MQATSADGSDFTGWLVGGGLCRGAGACSLTATSSLAVTAMFTRRRALDVQKTGSGAGAITSSPAGIDCGSDCTELYPGGQLVTLSATASMGSHFTGWSGGGCSGTGVCTVTIDAAMVVSAGFALDAHTITLVKSGSGSGTVSSSPFAILCGPTCSASVLFGTQLTFTASPAADSTFSGWSGAGCSGTGPCTLTVSGDLSLGAAFTQILSTLTVTRLGAGEGVVSSMPAGILCGATCSSSFPRSASVQLTASPTSDSVFTGWGGACAGTGPCTVSMAQARSVSATFAPRDALVTVMREGGGSGYVLTAPSQYDCGVQCRVPIGTQLTLTAVANSSARFTRWSNVDCPGTGPCSFTVTGDLTVGAYFELVIHTLTVAKSGRGSGLVASTPGGISCGAQCSAPFMQASVVTLNAFADPNSIFVGWSGGGCSGTGECSVTMARSLTVTANFGELAPP